MVAWAARARESPCAAAARDYLGIMPHTPKIATCCYCGARAALVLGEGRHELACASCGAPLHDLKRLPVEAVERHRDNPRLPARAPEPEAVSHAKPARRPPPRPAKTRKKRKSFTRWLVEEAFDAIEDIFD